MEKKTRQETLVSLYNDQLEKVINREASVRMLQEMAKQDAGRVLLVTPDLDTMMPKKVTVADRLQEMEENLKLDQRRLEELERMLNEEENKGA
jgi:hypothetical protein